jgi:hypothetical protein
VSWFNSSTIITVTNLDLYVSTMLGIDFSGFVMLAVLAFFIHVISPNKYIGYFGFIAFVIANAFVWRPLHVATNLVQFGGTPDMVYSDFYGYRPFVAGFLWFTLYWSLFCVLLAVASIVLWRRGRDTGWRQRLARRRAAVSRFLAAHRSARTAQLRCGWRLGLLQHQGLEQTWFPKVDRDRADRRITKRLTRNMRICRSHAHHRCEVRDRSVPRTAQHGYARRADHQK